MTSMPDRSTVVISHVVGAGTTSEHLVAVDAAARRRGVDVTWAVRLDQLAALAGSAAPIRAVADEPGWWESRATLRDRIERVIRLMPGIDTLVVGGGRTLLHRELLRDHGIRTVCVEMFDDAPCGSRRPAPLGWACRSLSWGLWEVALTAAPRGWLSRFTGRTTAIRPFPGGLTVLGSTEPGSEPTATIDRVARWVESRVATSVSLAALPGLVSATGGATTGSVLRAA